MTSNWYINSQPGEKAYDLAARQSPPLANAIKGLTTFFSPTTGTAASTLNTAQGGVEGIAGAVSGAGIAGAAADGDIKLNPEIYRRLRYQYSNLYIATVAGATTSAIGGVQDTMVSAVSGASMELQKKLKPISSFMGSTLGTMTGVLKDPIGSAEALPATLGAMMNNTNPALAAKYEATFKKYNIDKLAELPQNMFGNLQQMVKLIDSILAVPLNIVTDLYYGMMDIMKQINDLIDKAFEMVQLVFNTVIRTLAPGLQEFLSALADFSNQLSGISSIYSGFSQVTQYTSQLQTMSNKLNGFIQNPFDYAYSFMPPQVSSSMYTLRNPQTVLNQFVPTELANNFSAISKITGFGFNGKMGYGLQSVLEGSRQGVVSSILEGFSDQFSILAPLYTGRSIPSTSDYPNSTTIVSVPNGPQYNIDRTTGQVVRIMKPEPVIPPKTG